MRNAPSQPEYQSAVDPGGPMAQRLFLNTAERLSGPPSLRVWRNTLQASLEQLGAETAGLFAINVRDQAVQPLAYYHRNHGGDILDDTGERHLPRDWKTKPEPVLNRWLVDLLPGDSIDADSPSVQSQPTDQRHQLNYDSGRLGCMVIRWRDNKKVWPASATADWAQAVLTATRHLVNHQEQQQLNQHCTAILNCSDSIYATWNRKTQWSFHNVQEVEKQGYQKNQINLMSDEDRNPMHSEDWREVRELFTQCLETGEGYQHKFRTVGKNGETRWYHSSVKVTEKTPQGKAKQFTSISHNITGIKQVEERAERFAKQEKWLIQQTNRLFRCNSLPALEPILADLSQYLGLERCTLRLLDPATGYYNLTAEWHQSHLRPLAEIHPTIHQQAGKSWSKRLIDYGKAFTVDNVDTDIPQKSSVRNYYNSIEVQSLVTQPMIYQNQLIGLLNPMCEQPRHWSKQDLHVIKVISDNIHLAVARIRLIDELRTNEQRLQLVMLNSTLGLWDYDFPQRQIYLSPHFYQHLGYDPDFMDSNMESVVALTHPDDRYKLSTDALTQLTEDNNRVDIELRQRKSNGEYTWILTRGKVVERDSDGSVQRLMGVNMDISALKDTQNALEVARQKAEDANRNKSEFLERMSHEIRTPMNAITGMSYLMLQTQLNEEQRSYMEDIENAASSLLHIIDDILDFSKIESGELTIVHERFNIREELENIIKIIAVRAIQTDNELKFNMAGDIPDYLIGDQNRLSQVITNLLSNAVKFTSGGTVSLSVQCADVEPNTNSISLLFSVSDSGIGLTQEQIDNLFEPFSQADTSTSRKYGGTGLGLSICKNLVEMMGGKIEVTSLPDVGTTFHFSILFKQTSQTAPDKDHREAEFTRQLEELANVEDFGDRCVLLVEDNLVNQRVAQGILKKLGISSITASDGQEALDIIQSNRNRDIDLILMDIEMPVMDGLSTTRAIRKYQRGIHIPIIAMTAHAMVGDKELCLAAGMDDYIPKPIKPAELLNTLRRNWGPTPKLANGS